MNCMHCHGKMKRASVPFHIDRKKWHLTLNEIPAWVCMQCGEIYFEENEVDSVQNIIRSVEEQTKQIAKAA
ncbi:MAG: YgiT-type zinc finger protein [Desulfobacterales bacterium]